MPDNAFLWQEFHSSVIKEEELTTITTDKKSEAMPNKGCAETDEQLLAVLHHLVTFWEGMSQKIINHTSSSFSPPTVPSFAQSSSNAIYKEKKKEKEKLKKEKAKKLSCTCSRLIGLHGNQQCRLSDETHIQ